MGGKNESAPFLFLQFKTEKTEMGYTFITAADTYVDDGSKKKIFFLVNHETLGIYLKKKTKALAGVHSFTGCNEKKWFELAITGGLGLTVMSWTGRYYNAKRIVAKESRSGNDSKPGKKLLALQLRKGHRRPRQHHRPQQRRLHLKPRPSELVYLQPSPNYCEADAAAGSPGVAGRHCNRSSAGEK